MGFENGKLVRVVLRASVADDLQVNVLHYDLQDDIGEPGNDPQALADRFRDDVVPSFKTLFNSAWTIQPVVVEEEKDPQNPLAPRTGWVSGTAGPGTKVESGEQLPRACCQVASLQTGLLGRRFRGRTFVGGSWDESEQSGGVWTAGGKALGQAFMDAIPHQPDIQTGPSTSTANWCVYSRTQRGANLDPYAAHISSVVLRDGVFWLRSRQNSF